MTNIKFSQELADTPIFSLRFGDLFSVLNFGFTCYKLKRKIFNVIGYKFTKAKSTEAAVMQ